MDTLAKALISRASGQSKLRVDDVVICEVDLAMIHDSGGPRRVKPILDRLQRQVWDKDKIVVVTDHYVPADNAETQAIQALTKQWVQDQSIDKFYDEQGICHVVLPERGHLAPGLFCVGGDSHSPVAPLAPICLASVRLKWPGCLQRAKFGSRFQRRSLCHGAIS
jgi:3-isopropylmalate/(R)-2-methylmalate dehydratase large subunit